MNPVVHFDIHAEDPLKIKGFYEKVFGWKIQKTENVNFDYWLISTKEGETAGINGGLAKVRDKKGVINSIQVDDIDEAVKAIKESGGKIISEKMLIPKVGYSLHFLDPEENLFYLWQNLKKEEQKK
ncbi:glyoxalase-related [Anaeramoeba ignava]|uniref:Glyoxalase-related n=1 Tax=Anaeramoeba ignava TaxID=1746090 RepID=A0A9Q0R635_ANAIG|nr:glyoxalase-related [Anaeramoeba ignava]